MEDAKVRVYPVDIAIPRYLQILAEGQSMLKQLFIDTGVPVPQHPYNGEAIIMAPLKLVMKDTAAFRFIQKDTPNMTIFCLVKFSRQAGSDQA